MAEVTGMTPEKIAQEITNVKSYVDGGLSEKADVAQVSSDLSKKASTIYVNEELSKKASTIYVNEELSKKASTIYVNEELSKKADKTQVSSDLSKKADATQVSSDLSKKADVTYVDSANTDLEKRLKVIENRAPVRWIHYGAGDPVISDFPGVKVGDIIEKLSDGSRWKVEE